MAEQLGEALLVLRTDDRGLDAGMAKAKGGAEGLGKTLDDTSAKATRMGGALGSAGKEAGAAGTKTIEYSREVARLKAEIEPAWGALQKFKDQAQLLRQALDQGAITHRQYVEEMRKGATGAGLLTTAGNRVTEMTRAQRAGVQQLFMQTNDMATMWSLGARPAQIFASQIGQVTQAVQLAAGGTGRFARIMGSPWTMALSTAAIVLIPLIGNLLDTEDAADKAGAANETFAQKLDRQRHSLQEVIAALREYNSEQAKGRETALDNARIATAAANASLREALAIREKTKATLEALDAAMMSGRGSGVEGAGAMAAGRNDAQARLNTQDSEIARLRTDLRDSASNLADELAKIDADQVKSIRENYAERRRQIQATTSDVRKQRTELRDLYREEEAAIENARKAARGSGGSGGASAAASVGDMTALLQSLFPGARITSTTGGTHAKGSDHYAGRAIDFVPAGGMGSISTAEVERLLEEAGVTIRRNASGTKQLFGPGRSASTPGDHDDHFHVAWSGGASPEEAARRREQAEERRKRAEEAEAQRVERYSRDMAGLDQAAADIKLQLAATAEERYQLEKQGLEIAVAEQRRRIEANTDYSRAEKDRLLAALDLKASLERELLLRRRQEELARQVLEIAQATRVNQRDLLQAELRLAEMREDRRDIERRLLDLSYEQEKAELQAVIHSQAASEAQKRIVEERLRILDRLKAGDQRALEREYESPLERYRREVSGVGKSVNDQMEEVAVNGLKRLEDGLVDVIMQAKSLGDVFKAVANQIIADLIRIAIRRAIIAPIANLLGGGGAPAGGGGGGGSGLFGSLLSLGKSVFGGGDPFASQISGTVASIGSTQVGAPAGWGSFAGMFATGGLIPTGGFGIVGEAGPEPVFATAGGVGVLPNSAVRGFGGGMPEKLEVIVSGAKGDRHIEAMVRSGVAQGLSAYDQVVGDRVKEHLARRG